MLVDSFYNYLENEKRYSKLTVCSYRNDISQFLLYLGLGESPDSSDNQDGGLSDGVEKSEHGFANFNPSDYSAKDLRYWIMTLSERGLKSSSINRKISAVKRLYDYLYKNEYIESNCMAVVASMKTEKRVPQFVRESKIPDLAEMMEVGEEYIKERQDMILLMFYTSGVRLAELISLNIEDIWIDTMQMMVNGKGNKQRIIPILTALEKKLKNYLNLRSEICTSNENSLFLSCRNCRINRSEVYRIVKRELERIGVEGKKSPHILRHTFATHLLGNGAGVESIKELLGHASLASTQIYTHSNIEQLKKAYEKAHPRANYKLKI